MLSHHSRAKGSLGKVLMKGEGKGLETLSCWFRLDMWPAQRGAVEPRSFLEDLHGTEMARVSLPCPVPGRDFPGRAQPQLELGPQGCCIKTPVAVRTSRN